MKRETITIRNTNSDNIQNYIEPSKNGTVWMTKNKNSKSDESHINCRITYSFV